MNKNGRNYFTSTYRWIWNNCPQFESLLSLYMVKNLRHSSRLSLWGKMMSIYRRYNATTHPYPWIAIPHWSRPWHCLCSKLYCILPFFSHITLWEALKRAEPTKSPPRGKTDTERMNRCFTLFLLVFSVMPGITDYGRIHGWVELWYFFSGHRKPVWSNQKVLPLLWFCCHQKWSGRDKSSEKPIIPNKPWQENSRKSISTLL